MLISKLSEFEGIPDLSIRSITRDAEALALVRCHGSLGTGFPSSTSPSPPCGPAATFNGVPKGAAGPPSLFLFPKV